MTTVMKKVLASTLKELMDKKSLSKITINDLTQSCGVSRQMPGTAKELVEKIEQVMIGTIVARISQ